MVNRLNLALGKERRFKNQKERNFKKSLSNEVLNLIGSVKLKNTFNYKNEIVRQIRNKYLDK